MLFAELFSSIGFFVCFWHFCKQISISVIVGQSHHQHSKIPKWV